MIESLRQSDSETLFMSYSGLSAVERALDFVALEFAARRLRGEPIGFVLSRRGAKADAPLALDQTLPPEAVRRLLIGPLDGDSLGRLLRSRFDIHLRQVFVRVIQRPILQDIALAAFQNAEIRARQFRVHFVDLRLLFREVVLLRGVHTGSSAPVALPAYVCLHLDTPYASRWTRQ